MGQGILLSQGAEVDFMIHGVFSYQLFGQEFWITTTHICMLIVLLVIVSFCIAANRVMKHASLVPDGFQNVVELIGEAGRYGGRRYGQECRQVCKLHRYDFHFYIFEQHFRSVRLKTADCGLWRDFSAWCDDFCHHPF